MYREPPGALLPFGLHKGYALAVMCELLGGALAGGLVQHFAPTLNPFTNKMLSIVFAADRLCSRDERARQVAALAPWLRSSPRATTDTEIYLPGEPERATAAERTRLGIPLPRGTREALAAWAAKLGVSADDFTAG